MYGYWTGMCPGMYPGHVPCPGTCWSGIPGMAHGARCGSAGTEQALPPWEGRTRTPSPRLWLGLVVLVNGLVSVTPRLVQLTIQTPNQG